MPFARHNPASVPPPVGRYSQGLELPAGARILFISGQIPERPGQAIPADFRGQAEFVWQNISDVLAAAGMGISDLVKVTTFLTSREQVQANREVRNRFLGETNPAMTVIVAQTLDANWLLEIEAIAAKVDA